MPYKSIVVPLGGDEGGKSALQSAYLLGQSTAAHISAFHVRTDSKEAVPLLGEGMSGAMIEEIIDLADRESGDRETSAQAIFDEFCKEHDLAVVQTAPEQLPEKVTASWSIFVGREDEIVASRGRVADLVVVGCPRTDSDRPSLMTLHAAIFETGKAVLIVPPQAAKTVGARVAIAWNGSAEVARAVSAAKPVLIHAQSVQVICLETEKSRTRLGGEELVAHLGWEGIKASQSNLETNGRPVGEALLAECAEQDVDLLVMGAYTHSRVMQIILGGVTRHVVESTNIPVLMSH